MLIFFLHSAILHISLIGMADVLLNFYYVSLGYEASVIGVLQALPRLSGFLTGLPVGLVANRVGKRRILILSNIGLAASVLLLVCFPTLWMLALSRFLLGFFYGSNQIVTSPYLGTLAPKSEHTHQFAYHNLISMMATAIGSVLGGYLPLWVSRLLGLAGTALVPPEQSLSAYTLSLLLAAVIVLLSTLPLFYLPASTHTFLVAEGEQVNARIPWGRLLLYGIPLLFFGVTGGLTFPFYNLFFRERFLLPDATVGNILALGWLGMAFVPLLNPLLEKRIGRVWGLATMMGIAGVGFWGLGSVQWLPAAVSCYILGIAARNTMQPLFQPLVMDALPDELHNVNSSVGIVLWSIGWFSSTASFGWLLPVAGYGGMMRIVAVGVVITAVSIVLVFAPPSGKQLSVFLGKAK
ncbi:MAG: MFS transporter [Phototrophicaceae bacterium]|jgi:MFS family permease